MYHDGIDLITKNEISNEIVRGTHKEEPILYNLLALVTFEKVCRSDSILQI
jgi:hypothetical protein